MITYETDHMGTLLKIRRHRINCSLKKMEPIIGISESTIVRREEKETSKNFETWLRHFLELGIDPVEFFGLQEVKKRGLEKCQQE